MHRTEAFPPHQGRLPDLEEVRRAASILFDPDGYHELRGLPSRRSRLVSMADPVGILSAARELADGTGVYYTLNPVRPDLGNNAAKVGDILRRRWFLIDVDRRKLTAPDDSATADEKDSAWAVASRVLGRLTSDGWPLPVVIDSGNGFHLLYRVDLPNDQLTQKLFAAVLKRLAKDHDSEAAEIDVKVHNASRISKLPGTWACKGTESRDRPYRMARMFAGEETLKVQIVARELLEALAGPAEQPAPVAAPNPSQLRPESSRDAWLRKALEGECAKVAMASEGNRHDQLLKSAYALGGLLPRGLNRNEAEAALLVVGKRADPDRTDHEAVVRDGLDAGEKEPREIPDFERKPSRKRAVLAEDGLPPEDQVITTCFNSIQEREVEWLWPNRIPLGMVTMLAGEAKTSKSFLTTWLAAAVSAGHEMPDGHGECFPTGSVIILSAEDDSSCIIKPRLIAAGADLNKVHELTTLRMEDGRYEPFSLSYLGHLERAIVRLGDTKLVVIDPITSYVGASIDDHKTAQLRSLIDPIKLLSERRRVAITCVSHLNKGTGTKALNRVTGSGAYTALARANWLVCKDPEEPKRRLFLSAGINLVEEPPGLAYRIDRERKCIVWESAPVHMTADEALSHERDALRSEFKAANPSKVEQAEAWLNDLFPQAGFTLPADDVIRRGEAKGFSRDTVFVAKKRAGLQARKLGFKGGWAWFRPQDWFEESAPDSDSSRPHSDSSDSS